MQLPIYTSAGKKSPSPLSVSDKLFGGEINLSLLVQAVRVYDWNEHPFRGKTKTRSEVSKTTAKWFRQKGTGRARHGSKSAPIFVGGGIAHGPRGVRRTLTLPKSFVRSAILGALAVKANEKAIIILDTTKIIAKTKNMVAILNASGLKNNSILLLHGLENDVVKAASNIKNTVILPANLVNAKEILKASGVVITKSGLELLEKTFIKESIKKVEKSKRGQKKGADKS